MLKWRQLCRLAMCMYSTSGKTCSRDSKHTFAVCQNANLDWLAMVPGVFLMHALTTAHAWPALASCLVTKNSRPVNQLLHPVGQPTIQLFNWTAVVHLYGTYMYMYMYMYIHVHVHVHWVHMCMCIYFLSLHSVVFCASFSVCVCVCVCVYMYVYMLAMPV